LPRAREFGLQFARDEAGKDLVGDMKAISGEPVRRADRHHLEQGRQGPSEPRLGPPKSSRTAKPGAGPTAARKPKEILYYGAFSGNEDWVHELKAAIGYKRCCRTITTKSSAPAGIKHAHDIKQIEAFASKMMPEQKANFRIMSFGDEISLGQHQLQDPKLNNKFRVLAQGRKESRRRTSAFEPDQANLTPYSNRGLTALGSPAWFTQQFNEEERFAAYRAMTQRTKELIGPHVLTGANYSPIMVLYYGPIYQWVDIFKQQGMTMFWAEDYVFSVPEVPQIVSWSLAQARCAVKYQNYRSTIT